MTLCKRCNRPIKFDSVANLELFEGMHWLCFHLEFEHLDDAGDNLDPDEPCNDPSCPIARSRKENG
jgi:hypothetical protein